MFNSHFLHLTALLADFTCLFKNEEQRENKKKEIVELTLAKVSLISNAQT